MRFAHVHEPAVRNLGDMAKVVADQPAPGQHTATQVKVLVILEHLDAFLAQPRPVPVEVDFTALEAVEAVRGELARAGTVFALARVKQDLLARLESFGLAKKIGADRLFPTLPTAVEAYEQLARQHPLAN
jgi:hypothetical protein